jgi:hypothetical protein
MSQKFDDALNDCLERIAQGEQAEECVKRYPQHREELMPLLRMAHTAIRSVNSSSYRVESKQHGMDRMLQAYSEGRMGTRRNWFFMPFIQPLARPVLVGFVAVFLTAVAAGGSTMAAADSVPGEPLYWVKKTKENVTLMMPASNLEKAEAHARLASTRAQEIDRLIERNRIRDAEMMTRLVEYHLNETASYAGLDLFYDPLDMPRGPSPHNVTHLKRSLERDVRTMRVRLENQAERAPQGRRVKIVRIMQQSDLDYRIVIHAMNDTNSTIFWRNQPATLAGPR